ncbi:TIGR00282 family metallophosphoesterase [candidate division KSB1 bacterium]|nr:TIGR00282 family metallophosphoesterase [candidate division KSB1 bacterium]
MKILFIADIVGQEGFEIMADTLPRLQQKSELDLIIANGENGASGKGITPRIMQSYFELGINVITSGNHIWNKNKIFPMLDENPYILRPANYPPENPGHGFCQIQTRQGIEAGVINLQGRSFMNPIDCPFRTADQIIQKFAKDRVKILIVDFHAEATAEKIALGKYLDGRVSAVFGTHTHVQTADETIFPRGTGYITDAGMTGPMNSVIGLDTDVAIKRFISQTPSNYKIGIGNPVFCAVRITVEADSGKTLQIDRLQIKTK